MVGVYLFFFFKQKTAYEMRISDWSSDVCSSDLRSRPARRGSGGQPGQGADGAARPGAADIGRAGAQPPLVQPHPPAVGPRGRRGAARPGAVQPGPCHCRGDAAGPTGSASFKETGCLYVSISVFSLTLKNKQPNHHIFII